MFRILLQVRQILQKQNRINSKGVGRFIQRNRSVGLSEASNLNTSTSSNASTGIIRTPNPILSTGKNIEKQRHLFKLMKRAQRKKATNTYKLLIYFR